MNVFYDLETTGLETKHQILSACFVVTDDNFKIKTIDNYYVALNPLEIPAESAIAVNSVNITKHMLHHEDRFENLITEEQFASDINGFLFKTLGKGYNLIGYNSNKFDIKHIRKLLIKYGYNPYYNYNKFDMVDLYNHIKYLKVTKPKLLEGIDNLKLGTVFSKLIGKTAEGLHEAESDVLNCVTIAKELKDKYKHDIVKENNKVNNIQSLDISVGDVVVLINPYAPTIKDKNGTCKFQVFDISKTSVLLKNLEPDKQDEKYDNEYRVISKNDFCIAKKIGKLPIDSHKTIDEYYSEFEDTGVENFIYKIKFNEFDKIYDAKKNLFDIPYTLNSALDEIIASQVFTRIRPIKHTTGGIQYDNVLDECTEAKDFFIFYYEKYMKEEMDKEYKEIKDLPVDKSIIELIKDYKNAYRELYEVLSN